MSRNFSVFLVGMFLLMVSAIGARMALFTYDSAQVFIYSKADDELVQRRRVVYRGWYQRINDTMPADYRPNLRIYLVPLLFPEISYRYPNAAAPLLRDSRRAVQLMAVAHSFTPGPYEHFMIRYNDHAPGEIVFYHLGQPAQVHPVPWAVLDPAVASSAVVP